MVLVVLVVLVVPVVHVLLRVTTFFKFYYIKAAFGILSTVFRLCERTSSRGDRAKAPFGLTTLFEEVLS